MRAPDGVVYPMMGDFCEIAEPVRLAFASTPLDQDGKPLFEVLTTFTLSEEGGRTTQTLRASFLQQTSKAAPYLAGMETGWTQSLERLAAYLATAVKERSE
jgi:uncharacterized protein YndB with AHSA1/START domain